MLNILIQKFDFEKPKNVFFEEKTLSANYVIVSMECFYFILLWVHSQQSIRCNLKHV